MTTRSDQNKAIKQWKELKRTIEQLDPHIATLIMRGTFSQSRHPLPDAEPEIGTVSTSTYVNKGGREQKDHWLDLTGDEAISQPLRLDKIEMVIIDLAESIRRARDLAKVLIQVAPMSGEFPKALGGRGARKIPFCIACGDPCIDGARNGLDNKCRMRWERAGRPDRAEFIALVKAGELKDVVRRRHLMERIDT